MSGVLSNRDVNAQNPITAMDDTKVKSLEYHRQVLQSRKEEESGKQDYVSPSDNIMSPTTAKLSAMKNKHFSTGKPQSLFARTSTRNAEKSGLGGNLIENDNKNKDTKA